MDNLVAYIISIAASITVTLFRRPLWLLISGAVKMWLSDLPRISGKWTANFTEPTETGENEDMSETVNLHQLGRLVWGDGNITDKRDRVFKYRGSILRDTLNGTYSMKGSHYPAGTGTFQLKIAGNDETMTGWCLWCDRDTEKIEASKYNWIKRRKRGY